MRPDFRRPVRRTKQILSAAALLSALLPASAGGGMSGPVPSPNVDSAGDTLPAAWTRHPAPVLHASPTPGATGALPADVVSLPTSIDATGSTDVSQQLNAFLAQVPDGRTILFPRSGVFRIEQPVQLVDKHDLVLDGNDSRTITTTTGDRTRQHWRLVRGERIIIRNLTVVGANPQAGTSESAYVASLEAQHGFNVAGTHGLLLSHVSVTDVYGDFVYLGADLHAGWSSDVSITDSSFTRNGRQGIALTGARRVLIQNNSITETRRATFDLEPNGGTTGVEDVTIDRNRIGRGRLNFISAIGNGPVNRITVSNNTLTGRAMNSTIGNFSDRRDHWVMKNNDSDTSFGSPGGALIAFRWTNVVSITGNVQPAAQGRGMYGVLLTNVCYATVTGNLFAGVLSDTRISTPCSS